MLYFFKFSGVRTILRSAALLLFVSLALHAQETTASTSERPRRLPYLSAKVLIGLPGIPANSAGDLSISSASVHFTTENSSIDIFRRRIIAVSSGDERVETGGTTGKIARMVIPYGGGLALGAVTHKKVGLLTIEYLDESGRYHGAVFVLNTDDMANATEQLDSRAATVRAPAAEIPVACPDWKMEYNSVRVEVIGADTQSDFPPEDRALLYEHLVERLKSEKMIATVYRAGDRSPAAECAEFTIKVRADAFQKGDQAVRASVGPLGHFVGTTKLDYHLTVSKPDGTVIVDKDMKKSEGSDSDSLNITKAISKAVAKNLDKSRIKLRKNVEAS